MLLQSVLGNVRDLKTLLFFTS
ncbi:MAG: hypothetical protein QOD43_2138, partial [Gaiellaceae bacterium]|nr:hypothetical protein [Gaiellaceae bacterium]